MLDHECGSQCSPLETVYLYPADWSTCLLSESAICGQGAKERQMDCVRSDGAVVEPSVCKEVTDPSARPVNSLIIGACLR